MMTAQPPHSRASLVNQIRDDLVAASHQAPPPAQGYIKTLAMQLGRYAKANAENKSALRPAIEQTVFRIERAMISAGRTLNRA